jgi:hypothetical protein
MAPSGLWLWANSSNARFFSSS